MLTTTQDNEELIERVAALDIGKAELMCCVRTAHSRPGRCRSRWPPSPRASPRGGAARGPSPGAPRKRAELQNLGLAGLRLLTRGPDRDLDRVLVHVDPGDALVQHLHQASHLLQRHPPPMGQGAPPARAPGQYRRLTHAHAAATGVTRQGAPAPVPDTASNGPQICGDDGRPVTCHCAPSA